MKLLNRFRYDKTTLAENFGTINAENLRKAHAFLETGKAIGKIGFEGF
jgi:hypothetical protein